MTEHLHIWVLEKTNIKNPAAVTNMTIAGFQKSPSGNQDLKWHIPTVILQPVVKYAMIKLSRVVT